MSHRQQASRYQDVGALSASPGQLVVMLYDHLLVGLRRARIAAAAHNLEVQSAQLASCREVVGELLSTLDREKGGKLADNLGALYVFLLSELIDFHSNPDLTRLDRLSGIATDLRDAFAEASAIVAARPVAR